MSRSPNQFDVLSVKLMLLSNVIVDVRIPAGFTNVRSLAVAAFDLAYCSLSVLRFVFVPDISNQSP